MQLKNYQLLCFATIWIFARLRRSVEDEPEQPGFATIWIFARLRRISVGIEFYLRFATIWIFARLRPKEI